MADQRIDRASFCAQCGAAVVVADAIFCKNCGAPLLNPVDVSWRPGAATVLSIVPGLGQWYKGERLHGLLWLISVTALYSYAGVLGFLLHLICILNAGLGGAIREEALVNSPRRHRYPRRRRPHPMAVHPGKMTEPR